MSSHNSRLAADSYKNCVWTISGEAPEFRAPVSCGVPLRSCKAPDQISGAARTSQTLGGRGPSRGKVDEQARGSRPCVGIPVAPGVRLLRSRPGVPRVARAGSLRRPRSGEPPVSGLGNPDSPLPAPSLGSPGSLGIRKTGDRGGVAFPNPGSGLLHRWVSRPRPAPRTHRLGRSPSLWLSRGRGAGGGSGGGGWDGGELWNAPPGHLQRPGSRAGSRRAGEAQG
ncbi:translation initiation factor IF-2-like [Cervus canadensis]|uniref:translation initiation factor IF-2-like n=1 Tax=Cervus canadensis TaxID=1574408 RepID=UPI001C9E3748|nr:translation initiation factor IF-2-like [Cervus canadensis]